MSDSAPVSPPPSPQRQRLAELYSRLISLVGRDHISSGYLDQSPPGPPGLRAADGGEGAPVLSKRAWSELYFRLSRAALPGVEMTSLEDLEERAALSREAGDVPIALAHYRYHAPRPRFVTRVQAYAGRGGEFRMPAPDELDEVLEERTAFFAAPLERHDFDLFFPREPVHYGLTVSFVVPGDLFLTNAGPAPARLEFDLGDGEGYRAIAFDERVTAAYQEPGAKRVRLRVRNGDEWLHTAFDLQVAAPSAPRPDETWQLTSPISFQGVKANGHAWVYYGAGHQGLVEPVIIAEGFPGGYSLDYLWSILNEQSLVTRLLSMGKDVVILGFNQGTSYIEANAGVVIACVQRAIAERQGGAPLIVGGASMGGLVTRYALCYMEANRLPHQTRLYFSFDSPHVGANVPLSVQYFLSYFASESSFVKTANDQITSLAAKEMLLYALQSYSNQVVEVPSPLRTTFRDNLAAIGGYPRQPRLIGVANGVGTGQRNSTQPGVETMSWSGDANCVGSYLYSAPGTSAYNDLIAELWVAAEWSYYYFRIAQDPAFDSAPGGQNDFFAQLAAGLKSAGYTDVKLFDPSACFIPVISALAMDTLSPYDPADLFRDLRTNPPPSSLDAYQYDNRNDPHVTITPELAAWLLRELSQAEDQDGDPDEDVVRLG